MKVLLAGHLVSQFRVVDRSRQALTSVQFLSLASLWPILVTLRYHQRNRSSLDRHKQGSHLDLEQYRRPISTRPRGLPLAAMDTLPRSRSLRRLYSNNNTHGGNGEGSSREGSTGSAAGPSRGAYKHVSSADLHPALVFKYRKPGQQLSEAAAQAEWANKKWVWVADDKLGYVAGWILGEEGEVAQVACVDDKVRLSV